MKPDDSDATPMERFEEFGRKIFRVTKDDLKKAEEAVEKVVDAPREHQERYVPRSSWAAPSA